jgi:FkbM family methyltransferase
MRTAKIAIKHALWFLLRLCCRRAAVPLRVWRGPARGARLTLDLRSEGAYWLGTYDEYAFTRLPFDRYLREGMVAWDCGAFVGYYTAVFRKCVGATGRVVVFEASSRNFARLADLPALNGWTNVDLHHCAVGPSAQEIEFVGDQGGASGPLQISERFAPGTDRTVERVRSRGIDELVFAAGATRPDFIKFDLEGAEESALHNGEQVFGGLRPVLLLEVHGDKALVATGLFLERYRYAATPVHMLPEYATAYTPAWLRSLNRHAVRSLAGIRALPHPPHMLLVLPAEHPDWREST